MKCGLLKQLLCRFYSVLEIKGNREIYINMAGHIYYRENKTHKNMYNKYIILFLLQV